MRRRARWSFLASIARSWIRGILEHTARPALRWGLAMTTSYLIAAALTITAAAFLLSAVSNVFVELGVPPWAAQFILGLVAAVIGFIVYKKGRKKRLQDQIDGEEAAEDSPGLRVRVVKAPRRGARRKEAIFDVHRRADSEGWEVTSRSSRIRKPYDTKEDALKSARRLAAKAENGRLVVHRANGEIQDVVRSDR